MVRLADGVIFPVSSYVSVYEPVWSPDGLNLLFSAFDPAARPRVRPALTIAGWDGGSRRKLSDHAFAPVWTPDGASIAFFQPEGDDKNGCLLSIAPRVAGSDREVARLRVCGAQAWSPDGRRVAVTGGQEIYVVETASGTVIHLGGVRGNRGLSPPSWSSDGRSLFLQTGYSGY